MTAIDKGQQEQLGSSKKSVDASPALDELIAAKGLRKAGGDAIPVPKAIGSDEAEVSEKKSDQSNAVRWLQLLAAVGIPLVLVYLAFAGLVNPQFAELRELVRDNRDAIISNRDLISSNREAIAANASSIERLEDRIDLIAEVLILATTNENVTEAELRSLLGAGEE